MEHNSHNQQEQNNVQHITFVNTHLIHHAMAGVHRARAEFHALLERAEAGDESVQYELGIRCLEGNGVEASPEQA